MKENLIIVGDYNRSDFLYVARVMHEHYNIYFLEYTHEAEIISDQYKKWGKAIFWGDYKDALDLVDQIKPKMVVFYFIETFNHVALNVTCRYKGIRTYHMEHGIRNYEMLQANINHIAGQRKLTLADMLRKLKDIRSRVKGRFFFQNTVAKLPETYSHFLKEYFRVRGSKTVFETFCEVNNPLRIADSYISFSPKIFQFHKKSDHLPESYPVHFIGCPSFDYLADSAINISAGNNILFIDNAFETYHIFGWHEENKIQFLDQLVSFVESRNKKLWIKPHPYANEKVYAASKKCRNVSFIEDEKNFDEAINDSKIIIGFYSTLLMPMMAMEHTVCFSLEMHPSSPEKEPSMFLVETGATKKINNWEQLGNAFENLDEISDEQKRFKKKFIEDWLYKFDGKSTERLRNILLNENS